MPVLSEKQLQEFAQLCKDKKKSFQDFQNWEVEQIHKMPGYQKWKKSNEQKAKSDDGRNPPASHDGNEADSGRKREGSLNPVLNVRKEISESEVGEDSRTSMQLIERPRSANDKERPAEEPSRPSNSLTVPASNLGRRKSIGGTKPEREKGDKTNNSKPKELPPRKQVKLFDTQVGKSSDTLTKQWFTKYFEPETLELFAGFDDALKTADEIAKATTRALSKGRPPPARNTRRVRIAILDTGLDCSNPSISKVANIVDSYCPVTPSSDGNSTLSATEDVDGHGTHLTMLLRRLAPNADIYVGRIGRDEDSIFAPAIASLIRKAVDDWEVDIISMSFGFPYLQLDIQKALDDAISKKVLLFAAAANDGANEHIAYPANQPSVFAIFSTDGFGNPSDFNPVFRDDGFSFATLGENVLSNHLNNTKKTLSGTSIATPIAAATAALVLEFVRQKPLNGQSSVVRAELLETVRLTAMQKILMGMSKDMHHGYRYLKPWELLKMDCGNQTDFPHGEQAMARDNVARAISNYLKTI